MEYLDEDKVETLTNRVEREINEGLLPAAQIAIGFENKILFSKNFGDTKPDSLFCIFSATKAITAAASWLLIGNYGSGFLAANARKSHLSE